MNDKKLVAMRGEHWVCSTLAAHGWAPALTRDGLERTDVLAVHSTTGRLVALQVKTASASRNVNWVIGSKAQEPERRDDEWFVLVELSKDPDGLNRSFVIPRNHLSAATIISHRAWANDPTAKRARTTSINSARVRPELFEGYLNRWDLLMGPTTAAPILLSAELRRLQKENSIVLPESHPWHRLPRGW
jgi:hypothetical protein